MTQQGLFIAIEGIDGSGKTTLARALGPALAEAGCDPEIVDKTMRPGDRFGRGQLDGVAEALWNYPRDADITTLGNVYWLHLIAVWFTAVDRLLVRPALAEGRTVIVDGWVTKYIARFALKPEFDTTGLAAFFSGITPPHRTLWLDLPPEAAFARRDDFKPSECGQAEGQAAGELDFVQYQKMVAANLGVLAAEQQWVRIDGSAPPAAVLRNAHEAVLALGPDPA